MLGWGAMAMISSAAKNYGSMLAVRASESLSLEVRVDGKADSQSWVRLKLASHPA